ncbi:MAG: Signal recognition particle receptor FtsY [Alphaproteobacteria bacterium]|nr:MAG: Signal recognition particle receptor FtsY [Alphaproteobacteria bacterium]
MSLWSRLKSGLSRSSDALGSSLSGLMGGKKLSPETLGELEDALIMADLGVTTAAAITENLRARRDLAELDDAALRAALAQEIGALLQPVEKPFAVPANAPSVILLAGVNGAGKTTTIGKLAKKFQAEGKSVMLAACDTFRAAAAEQLEVWGARTNVPVVSGAPGADAAGLAFQALEKARADKIDILMIDTAGRLQSNDNLMAELGKIIRVVKKLDETAPHESLLVLDATTGQNAIAQAEAFLDAAETSGLIMTKLDGTARGGGLVAIAQKLALPIYFIGVGEQADDLQSFDADNFARALVGLEEEA